MKISSGKNLPIYLQYHFTLSITRGSQKDDPVGSEKDMAVSWEKEAILTTVGKKVGVESLLEE